MKAQDISLGMVLKVKKAVLESSVHADGTPFKTPYVRVTNIKERKGYSSPWIMCGADAFKPSDFECRMLEADGIYL